MESTEVATTTTKIAEMASGDAQMPLTRKEICLGQYANFTYDNDKIYCGATYDGYLCWPPTAGGETASQKCPPGRLIDTNNDAFRFCGVDGLWLDRKPNTSSILGWTNYTLCFPEDVRSLLTRVYNDEQNAQDKFDVAERTRFIEHVGYGSSLVALIISLIIFAIFRSLRNSRTRIHQSLFTAMTVQVIIRLTLYIDQAVTRSRIAGGSSDISWSIENMPYVCESAYILLEYASTVMFMWMLIKGVYLHNMVTGNCLRERRSHKLYYVIGWGLPVPMTAVWAVLTHLHYRQEHAFSCWYGYNFTKLYWILQGPRLGIIIVNLGFLLNIMRVLILKLRRSESNEIHKVRKAVRAALVLLPLLGITNVLNMIEPPLNPVWLFGLWSYTTHFLRSFQGFFVAVIYCFMNGEVRDVIRKHYDNYMAMRGTVPRGSDESHRCHQRCYRVRRLREWRANREDGNGGTPTVEMHQPPVRVVVTQPRVATGQESFVEAFVEPPIPGRSIGFKGAAVVSTEDTDATDKN